MQFKLKSLFVALAATATLNVEALLRFSCSQLVIERFDPLLSPGAVSSHLHQVVGGNAFNISMDPALDYPSVGSCTTCQFKEDFSNYWTAVLYYHAPNGTYKRVPQMPGQYVGNPNGGMTVYYIQPASGSVTAFKKGFRMIVGNAMLRSFNSADPEANSLNFRCLDANYGNSGVVGNPGTDSHTLPTMACAGGIRSQIIFPTCWDGVNLDSSNHKSHVAYPTNGACPSTHPVVLPELFLETIWDTRAFNSPWPSSGQPFVFSMGDPTGTGQHADYIFGWKGDSLQQAMNQCTDSAGGACSALTMQTDQQINSCTQPDRVDEPVDGWLSALPGCNPIQSGPATATMVTGCGAVTTALPGGPTAPPGGGTGPTTTQAPPVSNTGPAGATQTKYGQCGGQGWTGPTACASGSTCKYSNDWYSQCL